MRGVQAIPGDGRFGGPGWPIVPPSMATAILADSRSVLWSRGAVSWYLGAAFSGLWLVGVGLSMAQHSGAALSLALGIAALVVFWIGFAIAPPLQWVLPVRARILVVLGLFALSFTLWPWLGLGVHGIWTYVGVVAGMAVLGWGMTWVIVVALGLLAAVFGYLQLG